MLEHLESEDGNEFVTAYIDDVLVYSHTLEEHLHHLRKVIPLLRSANLKLKPSKWEFVQHEVEYNICMRCGNKHVVGYVY